MSYQIISKKRFNNKLVKLLQYFEKEWNEKTAIEFLNKLDKRIETLQEHPFIGKVFIEEPYYFVNSLSEKTTKYRT